MTIKCCHRYSESKLTRVGCGHIFDEMLRGREEHGEGEDGRRGGGEEEGA